MFHQIENDCVPPNSEMTVFHQTWEWQFHQTEKWPCSTKLRMTVFHQIEKWLCSTKLENDCVPPNWEMTMFNQGNDQRKRMERNTNREWLCSNWPCSTKLKNDHVPPNWEWLVYNKIEKWPCSTKLRNDIVPSIEEWPCSTKIRKNVAWLCSTKLRNDHVLQNWQLTVFHQIEQGQTPKFNP